MLITGLENWYAVTITFLRFCFEDFDGYDVESDILCTFNYSTFSKMKYHSALNYCFCVNTKYGERMWRSQILNDISLNLTVEELAFLRAYITFDDRVCKQFVWLVCLRHPLR